MNISRLLKILMIICGIGLFMAFANAQPGNDQRTISRWVDLFPTVNAPRDDATGRLWLSANPTGILNEQVMFTVDVSRLTCLGRTFFVEERVTAPFEVYLLKVNGESIVTFNTQCRWASKLDGTGGDFYSGVVIQGNESFEGWLEDPRHDPLHAEVYLESPMADPPTSILVLEGWLVE